jgi:hypothetical protein
MRTAAPWATARRLATAGPGGIASGARAAARARPSRSIVETSRPVRSAALWASNPRSSHLIVSRSVLERDPGQRQRQDALGPGAGGQPLVCRRAREREPGPHVDEPGLAGLLGLGPLAGVLRRRGAALEELAAEVDHEIGVREIEHRLARHPEGDAGSLTHRLEAERLVEHPLHAGGVAEGVDPTVGGRAAVGAQQHHLLAARPRLADPRREQCDGAVRPVPGEGRSRPALATQGARVAIGMVGASDSGLPAGAQTSAVDGMVGVALELDGTALAGLDVKAAARRALATRRSVVDRDPGRDLLGLDHVGDQLLHGLGAARGGSGTSPRSHELQEIPTVELRHSAPLPLPRLSNGR